MSESKQHLPNPPDIHRTVLLVDDDVTLLSTTKAALEASGFQVLLAQDGIEAIGQFKAHQAEIGVVLMDVVMPRLNGLDATRGIRILDPRAKIILSTAYSDQALASVNPDAILPKPYTMSTLLSLIKQVLLGEVFDLQGSSSRS